MVEEESRPIEVATPDQVAELNRLLDVVKLPEGMAEKWLAAANVDSWAEAEADKVSKVITALQARLIPQAGE